MFLELDAVVLLNLVICVGSDLKSIPVTVVNRCYMFSICSNEDVANFGRVSGEIDVLHLTISNAVTQSCFLAASLLFAVYFCFLMLYIIWLSIILLSCFCV